VIHGPALRSSASRAVTHPRNHMRLDVLVPQSRQDVGEGRHPDDRVELAPVVRDQAHPVQHQSYTAHRASLSSSRYSIEISTRRWVVIRDRTCAYGLLTDSPRKVIFSPA